LTPVLLYHLLHSNRHSPTGLTIG